MISFSQKPGEHFVYIQAENSEVIFQVFRFQERAYDAVLVKAKSTAGDFRTAEAVAPVLADYIAEAQKLPYRIIVGLHSGLFSSAQIIVTLRRDDPRRLIDEAELENLISSGLWKISSREQKEMARKMNTGESEVACIGALINRVRVDGHRVISPIGFPAHTVELTVLYSAAPRSVHHVLAPLLSGEHEVYCTEIGVSELQHLADQNGEQEFLFMRVSETHTYVYEAAGGELAYVDTIHWGRSSLIGALINELMMSREQVVALLARAESGLTSPHVRRRIEALLLEEVGILLNGIGAHVGKGKASMVYVSAPFSLPAALFAENAARRAGISVPIVAMPNNSHGEKEQSALPLSMKTTASSVSALCANAWAAQRSFEQSDLQKIAARRARWLRNSATR